MLRKLAAVTVIPAIQAVEGHPASLVCVPPAPPNQGGGTTLPQPSPPAVIYLYVPNNPNNPAAGEVIYYGPPPAPAGYVCYLETLFVPDPTFPGGLTPVTRTNCYWTYPP